LSRVAWSASLCVGHTSELCKSGRTSYKMGIQIPTGRGNFIRGFTLDQIRVNAHIDRMTAFL